MQNHYFHYFCAKQKQKWKEKVLTCHLFVELLDFLLLFLVLFYGLIHFGLMPSLH